MGLSLSKMSVFTFLFIALHFLFAKRSESLLINNFILLFDPTLVSAKTIMMYSRGDDGRPHPMWRTLPMSKWYGVPWRMGGTPVGNHLLRQLWPGYVDGFSVHHPRGLDRHALLGKNMNCRFLDEIFWINSSGHLLCLFKFCLWLQDWGFEMLK